MAKMPDLRSGASREDWFTQIRNLPLWQAILTALPLGLLLVGGLIGGLIGALGMVVNLKIARAALAPTWKVLSMAGVILGVVITYLSIAAVLAAAF
ncbi:hypothetical protein HW130_17185 [Streptomyces sp. PKU-EA00015]|uniref:hypothetical protein n=1 Tax=Streptomyces sp. PKU-EA00015 TaxID=2748326 RepID=UPI0015A17FA3|nr:hypothetical protein [Streptomyces sp. PKU-EA00015]NWF27979.1 hypothetical protein [Streptomyces sp. PKU-EA00015]